LAEAITSGSQVRFHFRLRLADGTEVDTSYGGDPLSVTLGQGALIDGLEHRLLGLRPGDQRRFEVPALEAFGAIEAGTLSTLPRSDFPPEVELAAGAVIAFATPQGEEVLGTVMRVGEAEVLVDFSHPLAGHDLIFEVEILEVGSGT
jgi:FKBP-type peptidyl-prolyl cis-trans isomerase 2